jgi:hypothetical protein
MRDTVNGLSVSTLYVNDRWETCIFGYRGNVLVDYYPDPASAVEGHKLWCEIAEYQNTFSSLQLGEEITLRRMPDV